MRGFGRTMFSKGLPPAKHSKPAAAGEIMENMTYVGVYGCNPTAPYHPVPSSPLLQILGKSHLSCVKIDIVRRGAPKHWVELVR